MTTTTRQVLVETTESIQFKLLEGKEPGRRLVIEGKIGHCDRETSNGRIYTRTVMEREVGRLQDRISSRSLFASVDHPSDGKCLGLGTPVLLADGRVLPVEQIVTGDRLMGPDGKPRSVVSTTTGRGPLYRVEPCKGESWVCNGPHVLTLVHASTGVITDSPLDEWRKSSIFNKSRQKMFSVGVDAFENEVPAPPVDPYFLGVWFGDGTKALVDRSAGRMLRSVEVSKPDPEIKAICEQVAAVWELTVNNYSDDDECPRLGLVNSKGQSNRLLQALRDLVGPDVKVPDLIMRGSRATRLAFLAGLLDTDGHLHEHGCFYLTQKREDWARSAWWIAKSLGLSATWTTKIAHDQNGTEGKYFLVTIGGDTETIPTRIPHKKAEARQQRITATRTGFDVVPLGEGNYYGFELDGDGRFLLGDFTVTHNSKIRDAGAICVGLKIEQDGTVIGRYEVVEGTGAGADLAALIRAGGCPGMSSRGVGSTEINMEGKQTVKEDFRLYGYDFVSDPACSDAYPKLVAESVDPTSVTPAAVRAQFPQAVLQIEEHARRQAQTILDEEHRQSLLDVKATVAENLAGEFRAQLRKEMADDFAVRLVRALQNQRVQVEEVVRSELLADPSVAGAKKTLEDISNLLQPFSPAGRRLVVDDTKVGAQVAQTDEIDKLRRKLSESEAQAEARLAEKEAEVQRVKSLQERALGKAREFAHKLYVERALAGLDDADGVRQMIGDPAAYSTIEDLQSGVKVAIEAAESARADADDRISTALQVERHKADIAKQRVEAAEETVTAVRERASDQVQQLMTKFEHVLAERDRALEAAVGEVTRLRRDLQESSGRASMDRMMAFADRRSIGHPRREDLLAAVQSGRISTEAQLNQLAEDWDIQGEEPGGVAERIRRSMSRGREAPTESERLHMELTESAGQAGVNGLDVSMDEIRQLAGIGNSNKNSRRF